VDKEQADRVWKIRDKIQILEGLKDQILRLFDLLDEFDAATRTIWGEDTKEGYYNVVVAWELLNSCHGAGSEECQQYAIRARNTIEVAEAKVKQVASELDVVQTGEAAQLGADWTKAFETCQQELLVELEPFTEPEEIHPPPDRVIKVSDTVFHLPCSVCGKVSVVVQATVPQWSDKEQLVVSGICAQQGFDLAFASRAFSRLDAGDLHGLHALVQEAGNFPGIDAYCPECDAIYCREHYNAEEEYDEGFYDDTHGTCPRGHRRMIDD
jgi:hypothetical protein